MEAVAVKAHGKINLTLDVLERRSDDITRSAACAVNCPGRSIRN